VLPGLLFAYMTTRVRPGSPQETIRVTRVLPVQPSSQLKLNLNIGNQEESYTLGEVLEYLNSADTGEARNALLGDVR
jgi:hypothetical protein